MKIIYIRETKETNKFTKKILIYFKKLFNIIKSEGSIYYLPIYKKSKITEYRIKKLTRKIIVLLEKDASNTIVLSEYLNNNQLIKNYLYTNNINILNGRYLFKCLIPEIISYIFKIKNEEMEFRRSFLTCK